MNIYVASSWRNSLQPHVVEFLADRGYQVYDFRHPSPGNDGFSWADIDPEWQRWTVEEYRAALGHELAQRGFRADFEAMKAADACVLVLPGGVSSHLEAGWFMGRNVPVVTLLAGGEPELMRLLGGAENLCGSMEELIAVMSRLRCEHESAYEAAAQAADEWPASDGSQDADYYDDRDDSIESDDDIPF